LNLLETSTISIVVHEPVPYITCQRRGKLQIIFVSKGKTSVDQQLLSLIVLRACLLPKRKNSFSSYDGEPTPTSTTANNSHLSKVVVDHVSLER